MSITQTKPEGEATIRPAKGPGQLGVRVVSGVVLLALVLAAIWVKGPLLLILVALAAGLGAHEVYTIARRAGYRPWYPAGVALALLLALRGYLGGRDMLSGEVYLGPPSGVEVVIIAGVMLLILARHSLLTNGSHAAGRGSQGWADVGITLGGALYVGGLLGYAPLLAALPEEGGRAGGTAWMLLVLVGTAACDTGAYFVGSTLGRHKLIPHISPAKTWEGLGGGMLGAVIAAVALSGVLRLPILTAIFLGAALCLAAVAGDLVESLMKRAAGVKDSGAVIPGHGGMLDRVDSILFVLAAVYVFASVIQ